MEPYWIPLALERAGYSSLLHFQESRGLNPTGTADPATLEALAPYLLGYRRIVLEPGDTLWALAQIYGTSVQAIERANPGLRAQNLPVGRTITIPLPFPLVPHTVPMTWGLCRACCQGLKARYPFMEYSTLTTTAYGRTLPILRLGTGQRKVLYTAAHHANEWLTTTVLLTFWENLAKAAATGGAIAGVRARTLLQNATIYLVPMVDPDGVDLVTGAIPPGTEQYIAAQDLGEQYPNIPFPAGWKANLLGVDLNLNYPAGWDQAREIKFSQGYTRPGPRDYVGQAPLDQRETRALAELTRRIDPALVLAYHSQGQVIYWQFQDIQVPGARALAERFARLSGYALEDTPYASSFAGFKDWFIQDFRRPGFTIEVGQGQNPLPLDQFPQIYRENEGILVAAAWPNAPGNNPISAQTAEKDKK